MKKKYSFNDHPEHRGQLDAWRDRWIANAMSTKPMDDADREAMWAAVRGLYEAAGLTPPPDHRIVFVPSPFVARFAGGFAAGIWHLRKSTLDATYDVTNDATLDATYDATLAATLDATLAATDDAVTRATLAATYDATNDATYAATTDSTDATDDATLAATNDAATLATTLNATLDATRAATLAATNAATLAATYAATRATYAATYAATTDANDDAVTHATLAATDAADRWYKINTVAIRHLANLISPRHAEFLLGCANQAWCMWDGGNQHSGWVSYLSFFRHVAKLDLPKYEKFQHYESACIHGGPRVMHKQFCVVSDRPRVLLVDEQNRPHCEDGPFCEWSDGTALFAVHGTRVPEWIVMRPERITVKAILAEQNAEVRRVMLDRMGLERFFSDAGAEPLQRDECGDLYRVDMADDEPLVFVRVLNSTPEPDGTRNQYILRVPPSMNTARNAVAWTFGLAGDNYAPEVET